jgi:hypothetical protein
MPSCSRLHLSGRIGIALSMPVFVCIAQYVDSAINSDASDCHAYDQWLGILAHVYLNSGK